jgi:hypothetical protein
MTFCLQASHAAKHAALAGTGRTRGREAKASLPALQRDTPASVGLLTESTRRLSLRDCAIHPDRARSEHSEDWCFCLTRGTGRSGLVRMMTVRIRAVSSVSAVPALARRRHSVSRPPNEPELCKDGDISNIRRGRPGLAASPGGGGWYGVLARTTVAAMDGGSSPKEASTGCDPLQQIPSHAYPT